LENIGEKMNNIEKFTGWLLTGFFLFVGFVGLIAVISLLNAFVLIKMWSWFIVPLFHLPTLNVPFAIGLALTIGLFKNGSATKEGKAYWFLIFIGPFITLFFGWIIHMFI
jgi:hypothetical protein